ncbi:uncharacterized protein TM35_000123010 [Trypanosoma theileri]|uniref:Uncharacterized protein n=1 Tax=Trypanosoma theileri TaxID=67003 RepID=A0A1X0NXV1_9TRYP|nr:uncharacterized protein TM35_000123010 [Trypanosoma theileri]ORC89526.1 hypothetical protein TM35_000123010 [Trypanosoma theileri]
MTSSVRFGNIGKDPHFSDNSNIMEEEYQLPNSPPTLHGKGTTNHNSNREVEQRLARIVAEYEYKLLEERARAQERETRLLEELQREKAPSSRERREQQQEEEEQEGMLTQMRSREGVVSKEEYERLQKQLMETRDLLQEAERRYQQEKRELLNLRTAQLRNETSKRGQEGDIIARAMQVMSEYEAVVRSGEENSLARLSQHMESFEKEWLRRATEFEQQKASFESNMMEKAQEVLASHQQDVESITRVMLEKTTQALSNHSELRLEMEQQVLRHVEVFKEEYKSILEKEFYDRCRLYDEKLAERERGWVAVLQEERVRIANAEREAVKEHERLHVESLESAMRELSRLREQLVREHREQQTIAMEELIERRERMDAEHRTLLQAEVEAAISVHREEAQRAAMERDKLEARLTAAATAAQQQMEATAAAVARARRERDEMWHLKVEEMRKRYDALLDEALNGDVNNNDNDNNDKNGVIGGRVSRSDYERLLRSVEEWEQKCVLVKQQGELLREQEREQLNEVWAKRLEEERGQREKWESEQLQHFAEMRLGLLQDVQEREKISAKSWQSERDALHKEFEELIQKERNQCALALQHAEEEAREDCKAMCKKQQEILDEQKQTLETQIAKQQLELRKREETLEETNRRLKDEAQQMALDLIKKERETLQRSYDEKFSDLYEEQQRWETKRSTLHEELASRYAERFKQAKEHMQQHLLTLTNNMLSSYQEMCEMDWLKLREKEMDTFNKKLMEYKQLMESRMRKEISNMKAQMEETLQSEREALKERERVLQETLLTTQKTMEDKAMERGLRLVEEQQRVMNEYCKKRAQEQQEKWDSLQSELLEKTWTIEADQRALMQQQQREHEMELDKERQRNRAELDQQRTEALTQRQRILEQQRQQEMELREKHAAAMEEERRQHDALIMELRKEQEHFLAECKQRCAATLSSREAAFELERKRLVERLDTQSREQQEMSNERVRALEEEYKELLRVVTVKSQENQQEYTQRVAHLEQQHILHLEQQQREIQRKYEEHIKQVRNSLETRLEESLSREAEMQRRVEEKCEVLRVESEAKCRAFIAEQQDRIRREQEKRQEMAHKMERAYCDHLSELQKDMEATLSIYFTDADKRSRETTLQIRNEFETKQKHFYALLEQERKRSVALEDELRTAKAQMDALQLSQEQQKLEALHEMQQKYDGLYKEMHEALRKERETWAKRALGEEEERLLKELTAREEKRRQLGETAAVSASLSLSPPPSLSYTTNTAAVGRGGSSKRMQEFYEGSPLKGEKINLDEAVASSSSYALPYSPAQTPSYGRRRSMDNPTDLISGVVEDDKLQQLWSVLEVPEGEQQQILQRWSQLPLPQRKNEIQKETRRLELQLPLLEVVTRREFVIHRLKELEKGSSLNNSNSTQVEELRKELRRLTEHLKSEIPQHEAMYGCTFRFRGARYMDTILDDCSVLSH